MVKDTAGILVDEQFGAAKSRQAAPDEIARRFGEFVDIFEIARSETAG